MINYEVFQKLTEVFHEKMGSPRVVGVSEKNNIILELRKENFVSLYKIQIYPFYFTEVISDLKTTEISDVSFIEAIDMLSYQEKNHFIFQHVDQKSKPILLDNANSLAYYHNENNNSFYLFKRFSNLYKLNVSINQKTKEIKLHKPSIFLKNVSYFAYDREFSQLYVILQESKVIVYSLPSFYILIDTIIPQQYQSIIPMINVTLSEKSHIMVFKIDTKIHFFLLESGTSFSFDVKNEFDPSICSYIAINTHFFLFFIPNVFISFIDCCDGFDFITSTNEKLVSTNYSDKLINFPQTNFDCVYSAKDLSLLNRKIDWKKISLFLEDSKDIHDWLFIAHTITHIKSLNSLNYIFKSAIELNSPNFLSTFITEYFISSLYQVLIANKKSTNQLLLSFIPRRFHYELEHVKGPSEAKVRPIVEDLVLKQSLREEETLSMIIDSFDKSFSPLGFMSISMTYLLYLLAYDMKVPKQKLPYPVSYIHMPTINFTSVGNETKKLSKDITEEKLTSFALDFVTKQTSCANMIPYPSDLSDYYQLLRSASIFQAARYNHLPISEREFQHLIELIEKMITYTGKMFLTRNGILQVFSNNSEYDDPSLWVRAPFNQGNFTIQTKIPTPFTLLPLAKVRATDPTIFEPLSRSISASSQFGFMLSKDVIDSYLHSNLESIYC